MLTSSPTITRPDVAVIVLTRNAAPWREAWLAALNGQTVRAGRYVVVDSLSEDGTAEWAAAAGLEVHLIHPQAFNHGGTRQWAANLCQGADWLVYMTQDAILAQPDSLERLLQAGSDPSVGLVFGRHVPRADADALESHARHFTYPALSSVQDRASIAQAGYRAAFASDVYAVYRASALKAIGGFPAHIIVSEDSQVAARLLLAGWKTVYCAEASVEHSHHHSLTDTLRRYFDIGVFHASEQALLQAIGKPDGEAGRYVVSLVRYLWRHDKTLLPMAFLQTLVKWLGFKLGRQYRYLPRPVWRWLSLHKAYWQQPRQISLSRLSEIISTSY